METEEFCYRPAVVRFVNSIGIFDLVLTIAIVQVLVVSELQDMCK